MLGDSLRTEEIKMLNDIVEEMKELYLKDEKPWICSWSAGKDSSSVLELVFQMLLSLPKEKRHKTVHVLMSNTLVETEMMSRFMFKSMEYVNRAAKEFELPIKGKIVSPDLKDRFYYNTLGRGLLVISPKARGRWCSHRLKIKPTMARIRSIIDSSPQVGDIELSYLQDGQISMFEEDTTRVVQLLGTRLDESAARAASIRFHEIRDTKFSRHSVFTNEVLCYAPLKYFTNDEIWLTLPDRFAWGIEASEMEVQYGKGFFLECGLQDGGEEKQACGMGSRSGCVVCPAMGLNRDKMLEGLISEGHTQLIPMYEWKRQLIEMRNDVRYREFERRQWRKQHQKRLASAEEERSQIRLVGDYFSQGQDVDDYLNMKRQTEYEKFDRANDFEYLPGGLSVPGRRLMLEKLLFIQKETGYNLISEEEVQAIIDFWNEEGYHFTREEVIPTNHSYDGALVLNKDGSLNQKETTTTTPTFEIHVDFEDGRDQMVEFIESRKKKTGKSFYYFTTHCDLGGNEQFVWNQAVFVVSVPGITNEKEARKLIHDWLNPLLDQPQEDQSLSGCVKQTLKKVQSALLRGERPIKEMSFLSRALNWIKEDEPGLSNEIRTLLLGRE